MNGDGGDVSRAGDDREQQDHEGKENENAGNSDIEPVDEADVELGRGECIGSGADDRAESAEAGGVGEAEEKKGGGAVGDVLSGIFAEVGEHAEGDGEQEGGGCGVGDPHGEAGGDTEEGDAGPEEASLGAGEDAVGDPAVDALSGESGGDRESTEEEEDEGMGEVFEGLGDGHLSAGGEDSGKGGGDGDQEGGNGEGKGFGEPEGGGEGEDGESGADVGGAVGFRAGDREEEIDQDEEGNAEAEGDEFSARAGVGITRVEFAFCSFFVVSRHSLGKLSRVEEDLARFGARALTGYRIAERIWA